MTHNEAAKEIWDAALRLLASSAKSRAALKKKLADEGLFDQDSKQRIPSFPTRIVVISSPTGAALSARRATRSRERGWPTS